MGQPVGYVYYDNSSRIELYTPSVSFDAADHVEKVEFYYGIPSAVTNAGTVQGAYLFGGGAVGNSGSISSVYGGTTGGTTVANTGSIGSVSLHNVHASITNTGSIGAATIYGGAIRNGDATHPSASIGPIIVARGSGQIQNFATISGVILDQGGTVSNYAGASIPTGISVGPSGGGPTGTNIHNYGTIGSSGSVTAQYGVYMKYVGGGVTNGGTAATGALIEGRNGVWAETGGSVVNYGTIAGVGAGFTVGVFLAAGSGTKDLRNGLAHSHKLLGTITGYVGVETQVDLHVKNYGEIVGAEKGAMAAGVYLLTLSGHGPLLTNGGGDIGGYLISGYAGVRTAGAPTTVVNLGTIEGFGKGALSGGVVLGRGGTISNGSTATASVMASLVKGFDGVQSLASLATVSNFGTIEGVGNFNTVSAGVVLGGGGTVSNGGTTDTQALVRGYSGVLVGYQLSAGTVVNYGRIVGFGTRKSVAGIMLASTKDHCLVRNGSGDATAPMGEISGFSGVRSAIAATVLNYGKVTGTGDSQYSAGVYLAGGGLLRNGAAANAQLQGSSIAGYSGVAVGAAATVSNYGAILGSGKKSANFTAAGIVLFGSGVVVNGSAAVPNASVTGYDGVKAFGAATVSNLGTITGAGAGTIGRGVWLRDGGVLNNGAGGLVQGATGVYATTKAVTITNMGTIKGGIDLTAGGNVTNGALGAAGAVIDGGQSLGITGAGTLTNFGTIEGRGSSPLLVDTGATTIRNAGVIQSTAAGGVTIESAVDNVGTLVAQTKTLTVQGAVSGPGDVQIVSGTADFTSTFNQDVAFTGATGTLELANSQTYTGKISGFAASGKTALDLVDIAFTAGVTKASFTGTAASGVLTVTDGTHTATMSLIGNFAGSTFKVTGDGHGGTRVVDPAATNPQAQSFVAAAAGLSSPPAPCAFAPGYAWRPHASTLANRASAIA